MALDLTPSDLNPEENASLYRQLADLIRDAIRTGRLMPDDELPSEGELQRMTGTSRTTVRQAITSLVTEGRLVKQRGRPTRVAKPPPVRHMSTSRYRDEMKRLRAGGEHPLVSAFTEDHGISWDQHTVAAEYGVSEATDRDVDNLGCRPGEPLLRRSMVKYVGGVPVQIQLSVIPHRLVEGTAVCDPARQPWPGGTIAELFEVGLVVTHVDEVAVAAIPMDTERVALRMGHGAVLRVWRTFYVETLAVEHSTVVIPGDRVELRYATSLD